MKRINASVMTVAVVLALIAFIAPSSAYSMSNGEVVLNSPTAGQTTWTFDVDGSGQYDISHFVVAWCNRDAVESVTITPYHPNMWRYYTFGYNHPPCSIDYTIKGIKVEFLADNPPEAFSVEIILDDLFDSNGDVEYLIKAAGICTRGDVYGPLACNPIPEFSTIAIPIASILGLLFFFNRRKRRREQ